MPTVAAMLAYPGGAKYDHGSGGYLFFQNFFSDLGATTTYSGRSNTTSHVLFSIAAVSVGLAMIGFSPTWRVIAARRGEGRPFGRIVQVACIVSGALYVLVLFAGPGLDTKSGFEFQVAAQKIVVYASILYLGAQAIGIRREARLAAAGTVPP